MATAATLLTIAEVAVRLGVSEEHVLGLIHRTAAPLAATNMATKLGGRPCWRIQPEAVEAFIAANANRPALPSAAAKTTPPPIERPRRQRRSRRSATTPRPGYDFSELR